MSLEPSIYFDEVNARQGVFHRRSFLLGGFAGMGALALTGRLLDLQVVEAQKYSTLSTANQFNFRLRPPPRGLILDRNGVAIASNRPDLRLLMRRDEAKDVPGTLAALAQLIPISPEKQAQLAKEIAAAPRSSPVAVATDLTWEDFARVSVRAAELPGVTPEMGEARVYPFGGAFSHVVGYVSKVTEEDLEKAGDDPPPLLLHPGFRIGKQGVEKSLDLQLRGKPGAQKVEVDSVGRVIKEDPNGDVPSVPGDEVRMTLDADIQNRALQLFGAESGAAVVMDVRNGDVLCMASAPAFDPNQFVTGAPPAYYHALSDYDHKPLLDKALSATYPPGSTFKTLVSIACLEHGYDPRTVHACGKSWFWGGRVWHCDEAHGAITMSQAIKVSCDIYFYQAALTVGPDRIADVARRFGLGQTYDIGIPGQHRGLIPDTAYKRRAFPKDPVWHPGETPSMGIGQGYVNVNPLQLCVQASRIANGVKAVTPRLIRSIAGKPQPDPQFADLSVDPQHVAFVRAAMRSVVNEPGGTVFNVHQNDLGLPPITWAGKTGTAQSHGYAGGIGAHGAQGAWALRDHAWFIAYAPADAPRYALSMLVEHGGFGAQASAPRAHELMKTVLMKDPEIVAQVQAWRPGAPQPAPPAATAPATPA